MNRAATIQPQLVDQVAVVTGGGRGIGAAVARNLASLGATVIICGRTLSHLEETAAAITAAGGRCHAFSCDVADLGQVDKLAGELQKRFGRVDILVNNAGIGAFRGPLHQLDPAEWDAVMNTNLRGVFYTLRAFAPAMVAAGRGHIINISSLAGKNALPHGAAYAASK